ncbi:hypothetical protein CPB83DRAFT_647795 [Crepidotus variabilis]|uniref:DUF427 domain-containing protein n=1 Tax=Crepidotus variabilis TaxID=179855 RepID=A0A9P6JK44_9AGAR|nr:hypothetical protein CPB83DRAFT_647795 [Crepidotus variabilis]
MVRVQLSGRTLAESKDTIIIDGNHYFPPASIDKSLLISSDTSSVCPWKGTASYYNAQIDGKTNIKDVAWYYPHTITDKAKPIENYVAFYKVESIFFLYCDGLTNPFPLPE